MSDKAAVEAGGGVSLGKGAWDCDTNTEIPPEKEVRQTVHTEHLCQPAFVLLNGDVSYKN